MQITEHFNISMRILFTAQPIYICQAVRINQSDSRLLPLPRKWQRCDQRRFNTLSEFWKFIYVKKIFFRDKCL